MRQWQPYMDTLRRHSVILTACLCDVCRHDVIILCYKNVTKDAGGYGSGILRFPSFSFFPRFALQIELRRIRRKRERKLRAKEIGSRSCDGQAAGEDSPVVDFGYLSNERHSVGASSMTRLKEKNVVQMEPPSAGKTIVEQIAEKTAAFTLQGFSQLIGISYKTAFAMATDGRLPAMRIGSSIRLDPKITAEWLRKRTSAIALKNGASSSTYISTENQAGRREARVMAIQPYIEALERYRDSGLEPDRFMRAVLEGDLYAAAAAADGASIHLLGLIALWVMHSLEPAAWGWRARIEAWMKARREE